jgi:hypothetical protein
MATEEPQETPFVRDEDLVVEQRSLSTNVELGLLAFDAVAPFVAPHVPVIVDKLTGANEPETTIILPAGVHPDE